MDASRVVLEARGLKGMLSNLAAGEAAEAVAWTVDEADAAGRLRGILDAIRSNRVEDDFSYRWSFAREDFERKLGQHDDHFRVVFEAIRRLMLPPEEPAKKRRIGFGRVE